MHAHAIETEQKARNSSLQTAKKKYTQMHASNEIVSVYAFLRSIWIIDSHVS